MANLTGYPPRSTTPETFTVSLSFLGNGAAQPLSTQIFGAKGFLATPFSGTGINRTGAGLFTLNLRDSWQGRNGDGTATSVSYQALLGFDGTVAQAAGASTLTVIFQFVGLDLITNKQIKFTIQNTAGTATDPTSSQLVCLTFVMLNSTAI